MDTFPGESNGRGTPGVIPARIHFVYLEIAEEKPVNQAGHPDDLMLWGTPGSQVTNSSNMYRSEQGYLNIVTTLLDLIVVFLVSHGHRGESPLLFSTSVEVGLIG